MYNIHHKPSSLPQVRSAGHTSCHIHRWWLAGPQISPNITIFTNSACLSAFKMSAEPLLISPTGFALSGSIFSCACTYLRQWSKYSPHEQVLKCFHNVPVSHRSHYDVHRMQHKAQISSNPQLNRIHTSPTQATSSLFSLPHFSVRA